MGSLGVRAAEVGSGGGGAEVGSGGGMGELVCLVSAAEVGSGGELVCLVRAAEVGSLLDAASGPSVAEDSDSKNFTNN